MSPLVLPGHRGNGRAPLLTATPQGHGPLADRRRRSGPRQLEILLMADVKRFYGMNKETFIRLRYPFPVLVNPNAAAMQDHTVRSWIQGELKDLVPPEVAGQFEKTRTAYMASYF